MIGLGGSVASAAAPVAYAALAQALVAAAEAHIGSEAARVWAVQQAGQLLSMATVTAVVAAAPDAAPPTIVPAQRLVLDEEHWEVRHDELVLQLTLTQYRLLGALIRADSHTVPTRHLATLMFGSAHREGERVAAHVRRLRRRLVEEQVDYCTVETVRGVGYRLTWAS